MKADRTGKSSSRSFEFESVERNSIEKNISKFTHVIAMAVYNSAMTLRCVSFAKANLKRNRKA